MLGLHRDVLRDVPRADPAERHRVEKRAQAIEDRVVLDLGAFAQRRRTMPCSNQVERYALKVSGRGRRYAFRRMSTCRS